ncbi:rRNA maturation RNase YbeY [Dethiosulfatarculus sandiegensis]|uniref:rRNA maturation RNase YbeY n=1 Tax=Dethiosulfatarculus sandiegensis TaxID=1429043 RepID=UPI0009E7BA0D|nr:rRNA maturation RNase YbeY [Dethiosulfatarculus sandiegensis]
MQILISNRQQAQQIQEQALRNRLQQVLEDLECTEDTELSLVITDDEGIAPLNEQYLGHMGPTNVLSFPLAEGEFTEAAHGLLGDVVVSVETARKEADENGLDPQEHFVRLIIHGILHLLGYDHLTDPEEAREMEDLTEKLLNESKGQVF